MADCRVDKTMLRLLAVSVLLHLTVFVLIAVLPTELPQLPPEPVPVDLSEISQAPPAAPDPAHPVKRIAKRNRHAALETAPAGIRETDQNQQQPQAIRQHRPKPASSPWKPQATPPRKKTAPAPHGEEVLPVAIASPPGRSAPLPGSGQLARRKESYRKKYASEVAEGKVTFLDTSDSEFGSFLRRFESGVQEIWRYPEGARLRGIAGVTPVKITFKQGGEIVQVNLLESSGSRILDDEVIRSLKRLGPLGSFPKSYHGQEFSLIAFFEYSFDGGSLR